MKKWVFLLIALALPFNYALYHTHIKRTRGFSIDKITPYNQTYNPVWDINYSNDKLSEVKQIIDQPFSYFGSGKTCYVFLSADQNHVIKLFKQRHMRPFSFLEKMMGYSLIPDFVQKLDERMQTRSKLFTSFKIAHNDLQDQTGLVYLHLQPTSSLNQTLYFTDKEGRPFTFEADKMEFLIQKRAMRTFPILSAMIEKGQFEEAKTSIQSIEDLITIRCQKFIDDDDNNCERNIGLIDGKACEIDIGEFSLNPKLSPEDTQQHIEIALRDLNAFLQKNHPEFYESIQNTR